MQISYNYTYITSLTTPTMRTWAPWFSTSHQDFHAFWSEACISIPLHENEGPPFLRDLSHGERAHTLWIASQSWAGWDWLSNGCRKFCTNSPGHCPTIHPVAEGTSLEMSLGVIVGEPFPSSAMESNGKRCGWMPQCHWYLSASHHEHSCLGSLSWHRSQLESRTFHLVFAHGVLTTPYWSPDKNHSLFISAWADTCLPLLIHVDFI